MTRLELAAGMPPGLEAGPRIHPLALDPVEALRDALRPLLLSGRCAIAFSGGRDSSALLALATDTARRERLPLPLPVTLRFPRLPSLDESGWQERLVRHLGLPDWERVELHDELDFVGPVAGDVLRRHGVLWPANAHGMLPFASRIPGWTLVTGMDGDMLFAEWSHQRVAGILTGRRPMRRKDVPAFARSFAPVPVRRLVEARRRPLLVPWLRPGAAREIRRRWADGFAREPFSWAARVDWFARQRYLHVALSSVGRLLEEAGIRHVAPLTDPWFLAAMADWGGRLGKGDRTEIMDRLFGGLLPADVVRRADKAYFTDAYWGPHTRRFMQEWDGTGLDEDLIDVDALREAWRAELPLLNSATPLQAAWLSRERAREG